MHLGVTVFGFIAGVLLALGYLRGAWLARRAPRLRACDAPAPSAWPRLTVVVPACDEAKTIERALATLLGQDYPALEVIVVDDRSTDDTGAIIDRLAEAEPRLVPIHVHTLPQGWLGKVHALETGLRRASGEWVLFTDADVHFAPGVLRRSVACAIARGLDHLTLLPRMITPTFALEIAVAAFAGMLLQLARFSRVGDPGSDAYFGVGAFNLVRRAALPEGLDWLRLEVADDMGLALLLQRAGRRSEALVGLEDISVEWYSDLPGMVRGLEKNAFAGMGYYRLWLLLLRVSVGLSLLAGPILPAILGAPFGWAPPLLVAGAALNAAALSSRAFGMRFLPAALAPLGQIVVILIGLRSALVCWWRGGVTWRGTTYPLAQLRAQQRVRL